MSRPYTRRLTSVTDRHRGWLELVDREGPFVAVPALKRVWPQGIGQISESAKAALRDAKPDIDRAWDQWFNKPGDENVLAGYRGARDKWVTAVLQDVAGWGNFLTWDMASLPDGVPRAASPDHAVTVEATGAFVRGQDVGALVLVVDPVSSLRDPYDDAWSANPIDRMDAILRASGHPVGVVTDGRWWAIVSAQTDVMTASGIVDSQTWIDEGAVRDAFFALTEPKRLLGGAESDRLPALFRESVTAAEEITVALGTQVRRAVELLVSAFSESAIDARDAGRPDPLPADRHQVYEGAVTAMMRVVFLLFAEERSMMPQSALFTEGYGISDQLDVLEARFQDENAEALDGTHHTWHRLLATSQALYSGVSTEDMRLPAYGGSLFDAERFAFLTTVSGDGALSVTASDRVMLEVLKSVQYATVGNERRRISFRDIDVEQIGYIYEGLLGYTAEDVTEVTVGLVGKDGEEPEVPLGLLDDLYEETGDDARFITALLDWLKKNQSGAKARSGTALKKALVTLPDDAERALLAVTRDEELLARLRPYVGIIRRDLRDRPIVIQPGGLAVVETPSRANSGAHYTPKSLAQEVVLHALEPLVYSPGPHQTADRDQWRLIRWNKILDLKVADIACGSGAFLVAAAEYLAGKLVEAWHAEGIATGTPHQLEIRARRQVVAGCLYGADINGMAVEMCKLSLWLVSLDPGQPFSFVDDKVLHGNSLLGVTDIRQLDALHIDPTQAKTFTGHGDAMMGFSTGALFGEGSEATGIEMLDVGSVIHDVIEARRDLASPIEESDPARSAKAKRRLLDRIHERSATLSKVADGVIAAGLRHGGKPGKKLNEAYDDLRIAVDRAFLADGVGDSAMLDRVINAGLTPDAVTDYDRWKPLHWALAVPDVLGGSESHGGFDAIIGNPPFLGGQKLTGAMGTNVRDWFVNVLADGARGSADLVGYFFLRVQSLLSPHGTLGLIATNTIAQGDTRQVGLDRMVESGLTITRAIQSRSWPAQSANLEYAAVWGSVGLVPDSVQRVSDGVTVQAISTLLEPAGRATGNPMRLVENADLGFIGCYVLGMGFVLEPDEAQQWIADDPRNAEVLRPLLGGTNLYGNPDCSASRWVIDFNDRSEVESAKYEAPFARVLDRVKPERMANNRKVYRDYWWQYAEKRPKLRRTIENFDEVLVLVQTSKGLMPVRVPTGQIFTHKLVVFASGSYNLQAVLSSNVHQTWAICFGSSMRVDPVYTPSDVFETFPRPAPTDRLAEIGRMLDTERRETMLRLDLGLTKLYNRVNDPEDCGDRDVERLRQIHVELDHAVMAAYGWDGSDGLPAVPLDHGFHTYRQMERWTVSPAARVEILDRLLELNHSRAAG
ncbi:Eco57I restriction-modification methylase domain-containing protein [Promicromonospora sp. NPDC057138]|uniref:Eco57I restriction-modification methylase domain-containing protein n=1 Tax=Promicromonospora sp. NPDC057138 TaxID=3346031 RepID=UPI00363CB173